MSDGLLSMLTKLRLSGLGSSLEIRLQEASASGLTHREFLELVLQDELLIRNDRAMQRRITMAGFRDVKRLEDFDFGFNPSIKKNVVFELAACRFVREKRDALLLGPPGTGKSHLKGIRGRGSFREPEGLLSSLDSGPESRFAENRHAQTEACG